MNATASTGALARFQEAFSAALRAPGSSSAPPQVAALADQPAFAVYRNTVMKGCIDALQANYPSVARLVGEEWFRAAAAVYARNAFPDSPVLLEYGADFPDFLAGFGPAADLPYLPAVAQLDRYWTEVHVARDEAALDPTTLSRMTPDALADVRLQPHAAARWAWFGDAPVLTIWSGNHAGEPLDGDIEWAPEGALITRPNGTVQWAALDAAGCAFLDACAAGATLAGAAQAALALQGNTDLTRLMAMLLEFGAFSGVVNDHDSQLTEHRP